MISSPIISLSINLNYDHPAEGMPALFIFVVPSLQWQQVRIVERGKRSEVDAVAFPIGPVLFNVPFENIALYNDTATSSDSLPFFYVDSSLMFAATQEKLCRVSAAIPVGAFSADLSASSIFQSGP